MELFEALPYLFFLVFQNDLLVDKVLLQRLVHLVELCNLILVVCYTRDSFSVAAVQIRLSLRYSLLEADHIVFLLVHESLGEATADTCLGTFDGPESSDDFCNYVVKLFGHLNFHNVV